MRSIIRRTSLTWIVIEEDTFMLEKSKKVIYKNEFSEIDADIINAPREMIIYIYINYTAKFFHVFTQMFAFATQFTLSIR